jgi:hypothetical protein
MKDSTAYCRLLASFFIFFASFFSLGLLAGSFFTAFLLSWLLLMMVAPMEKSEDGAALCSADILPDIDSARRHKWLRPTVWQQGLAVAAQALQVSPKRDVNFSTALLLRNNNFRLSLNCCRSS